MLTSPDVVLMVRSLTSAAKGRGHWIGLPQLRRVVVGMAWMDAFTTQGAALKHLPKSYAETWSGKYLSGVEMMVAAAALGYRVSGRELGNWKYVQRRHQLDPDLVQHGGRPFDVLAQHERLVRKLNRVELVPYAAWWPAESLADIEAAADLMGPS